MDVDEYLKGRVDDQLKYYKDAATGARKKHIYTQSLIIIFGLLVPVMANLPAGLFGGGEGKTLAITVLSLLLASLTGIANFRKYGDLWLAFRTTEELLKKERFLFLTEAGHYKESGTPFKDFVERVEATISVEHERFRTVIESSQRPTTSPRAGSGGAAAR